MHPICTIIRSDFFQSKLAEIAVEFCPGISKCSLYLREFLLIGREVNLRLFLRQRDVAGDIEVVVVLYDFTDADAAAIPVFLFAETVGIHYFADMLLRQGILLLILVVVFCGIDKEDIVGLSAFLEHDYADGDTCGVEEVARKADDAVDIIIGDELLTDGSLSPATEQDTVRENNGHRAAVAQIVKAVQQKAKSAALLGATP